MKNIIKRGTSLLLVLAMLLSFAAVVGATDATTTTPEKILTLTVENKLLRAGQTEYLAVYEQVAGDYKINALTISATSTNSKVVVKGIYPWIPKSYLGKEKGWDYDYNAKETVFTSPSVGGEALAAPPTADPLLVWTSTRGFQTSDKPLCFIAVEAQEDVTPGAYQINICRNPHPEKPDDHFLFAYPDPVTDKDLSQTEENAILNPGTVVVIPQNAELPTVILTKTAFEAPTQAGLAVGGEAAGDYDLTKYVKLVTEEGLVDVTSLSVTVNGDKSVSLKQGNVLSLATTAEKDKGYKLTVTAANGEQLAAAVELPFTVSKQDSAFTMAGFTKNGGYSMDFAGPYEAPAYSGTTANKFVPLDPKAYDQYGMPMGQATTELKLYSDAACTKEITSGNAVGSVTVAAETGSVKISRNLQADVWCKVRASATIDGVTKTSEWITFQIKSNYPQAASATLELRDKNDKEFPSGPMTTIAIPWGEIPTNTYTVHVSDFRQANGEGMPTGTEPSAEEVIIALDGTYTGVSISNGNKLVIDKTAQAGTVTVKATLNGRTLGMLTLTLQRAASKATDAGVYDCENKTANTNSKVLPTLSGVENGKATLPGIREGDKLVLTFGPGCVVDQYGEIYQVEGKDFLRPSQYALYKQSSTNPETYELCAEAERSVNAEGVVTATIKNSLDSDGNLRVQPGTYKFGTYNDNFFNGTTRFDLNQLLMSKPFELVEGEAELSGTPIYYDVETGNEPTLYVPYTYGTLDSKKATTMEVGATITTQYGRPYGGSETPAYALNNVKLNEETIENKAITWTAEADGTGVTFTVDKSAAQLFGTSNTATLTAEMTVTVGEKSTPSIPISITLRKDASKLAHLVVTGTPNDGTAAFTKEATILDDDVTASYNLIVPNTGSRTYTIALSEVEDQYGTALTDRVSTSADVHSATYDNGILTINPQSAGGKAVLTFTESGTSTGHKVELTLNFAQMSFVNSAGADYKVDMWMNTMSKEYAGKTWAELYNQIKRDAAAYPDVYIRGENNTLGEKVTDKVRVVVKKDGTEVFDSSKTYTEAPKANAGTYTIELVYQKDAATSYPIDRFNNFIINKATVTITATGITKEYDGSQALPAGVTNASFTQTGVYDTMVIDPSALQYESADASAAAINIVLAEGKTTCLTGAAAANYDVNLSSLTGTITKRMVVVSPNFREFLYGENDKITEALSKGGTDTNAGFTYAAKTGTLPTGEKAPTFSGSMCLMNGTERLTIYNAGEYSIAQGDLTISSNYQIEWSQNDDNKTWLITPKTVDPFDVTLQAEYGINGSELYAMLNTAKVTVDGKEVNLSTVYNVNVLDIEDAGKNKVSRTGTDAVNAGEYTVTNWTLSTLGKNYTFNKVPTLKIKVKPHTLTPSDIHSTDNWKDKTYNGENQTFTNFEVSFKYNEGESNERTIKLVEGQDYVIVDNSNTGLSDVVHLRISAKEGNTNYTGTNVYAPDYWSILAFSLKAGDLEIYQTNTLTYNGTEQSPTLGVRILLKQEDDSDRYKVLQSFDITKNFGNLRDNLETNAGAYTGSGSFRGGFTAGGSKLDEFTWTIGKSDKTPIQNQTASTKYGQPGSKEISVSDGVKKGLDTSDLSVSVETDADSIIKGTPSVTFENGKIIVNWQLQGDATTIDKTATLSVTVAETDNYKPYTFDVVVTATKKLPQTGFGFTTATNVSVGYAEDTYNNPVQNAQTTPVYTSSKPSVATVDSSSGVVTILDVGETIITATAPEDAEYASDTVSYTLTVVPSPLTVTASSATMTANDPVPSFTASVTGLKSGQTAATVFQTLTASAATDGKTAGTYAVNASATLKADFVPRYTLRFVPGTLTVNPAQTAIDVVLPIIIGGNTCANGYANCACEIFYDLDASRWYHESIDWAYNLGLMNGTTKSTFGPNAAATRAQTWTMLARIAGQDTRRSSTWYEVGQKWAMNLGITDGTNPMGSLTREQLAAMLYRYVGSPAVNGTLTFTDSANVSTWARNAMIWAVQNGILDGVGGNRLNPKGTTTRAQAAAIFMRFSKLINK